MSLRRTRVKFCGMTSGEDIAAAVESGADAVGFILAESVRKVPLEDVAALRAAVPPLVTPVAVVARQSADLGPQLTALGFLLQFSGRERAPLCERLASGKPYIKTFHMEASESYEPDDFAALYRYEHATWLFDAASALRDGGTGRTFDWNAIAHISAQRPVIVAGGLTPENVGECIRAVRPYAVDVRTGIETDGRKDRSKMGAFIRAVREADAQA